MNINGLSVYPNKRTGEQIMSNTLPESKEKTDFQSLKETLAQYILNIKSTANYYAMEMKFGKSDLLMEVANELDDIVKGDRLTCQAQS